MNREPVVSVVICFLDAERFLRDAVASVFAQTFDDWELLLVDDGSRDRSRAFACEVVRAHPERVRVLEHPGRENRGISASRNRGLADARGRYVAFLDADDVWLPEKLARQVELLEAHPRVAMTYGATRRWHGWSGDAAEARRDLVYPVFVEDRTVMQPPDLLTLYLRTGGAAVPGICSLLVRRDAAIAVGGFDDRFRGVFEDQVFYARIGLRYAVLVTDDCTALYRQHPDSCCADALRRGEYDPFLPNEGRGRYLRWLRERVIELGVRDPALSKALRRELRPYRHPVLAWPYRRLPWLAHRAKRAAKALARGTVPAPLLRFAKAKLRGRPTAPPPGWVRLGSLRRLAPLSRSYGYDRGLPIDRHYIESFLAAHAGDLRGHALEVGDDSYTRRFGASRVERSDVLHVVPGAPGATLIADLAAADHVPSESFDCIVLTQTLQLIYELPAAIATLHRILRPGGVVLATVPGISQIADEQWRDSWFWSLTPQSARRLFGAVFAAENVEVEAYGNVLAATAFLYGMSAGELRAEELAHRDPSYPLLVAVRATKAAAR